MGAGRRLDLVIVERGLAPTRAKAAALILAGRVYCADRRLDKPGMPVDPDSPLRVEPGPRYVGRGGVKLAAALERFGIEVRDRDALDVGASTGGFTHALLLAGARRVVALDVGKGQLDWSLRNDPRVVVLDGINARYLDPSILPFRPQFLSVDVSFIPLALVLPAVIGCLEAGGEGVALVKPQFEVGRAAVGKGGIVRDPALHREVLVRLIDCAAEAGWGPCGLAASPLLGAEGNAEFLLHLRPGVPPPPEAWRSDAIDGALAAVPGSRP